MSEGQKRNFSEVDDTLNDEDIQEQVFRLLSRCKGPAHKKAMLQRMANCVEVGDLTPTAGDVDETKDIFSVFPVEIILFIFSFVTAFKDRLNCKLVCKDWGSNLTRVLPKNYIPPNVVANVVVGNTLMILVGTSGMLIPKRKNFYNIFTNFSPKLEFFLHKKSSIAVAIDGREVTNASTYDKGHAIMNLRLKNLLPTWNDDADKLEPLKSKKNRKAMFDPNALDAARTMVVSATSQEPGDNSTQTISLPVKFVGYQSAKVRFLHCFSNIHHSPSFHSRRLARRSMELTFTWTRSSAQSTLTRTSTLLRGREHQHRLYH